MKHVFFPLLTIVLFFSCQQTTKKDTAKEETQTTPTISQTEETSRTSGGRIVSVPGRPSLPVTNTMADMYRYGKIVIYEGNPTVYYAIAWWTRSQIVYKVLNPEAFALKNKKDRILKLEGKKTNFTQWSGEIEVTAVLEEITEQEYRQKFKEFFGE